MHIVYLSNPRYVLRAALRQRDQALVQLHAEVGLLRRALHLALPHALAAAAGPPLSGGLPGHTPAGFPPGPLAQPPGAQLQTGSAAEAGRVGPGKGISGTSPNLQIPRSSPVPPAACESAAEEAAPAQQQLPGSVLSLPAALEPSGPGCNPNPGFSCPLRLHGTHRPQHAEPTADHSSRMPSRSAVMSAPPAPESPSGAILAGAENLNVVPEVGALATSLPGGLPSLAEVLGAAQRLSRAHALPAALPPGAPPLHEHTRELTLPGEPAALPPWASTLRMPGDQLPRAAPSGELSAPPPAAPPSVPELLAAVDEAAEEAVQAADSQESSEVRQSPSAQQPALLLPSPGTSLAGLSSAYEALVTTPLQAPGLGAGYASPPWPGLRGTQAGCAPVASASTWALAAEACLAASAGAAVTASQVPQGVESGFNRKTPGAVAPDAAPESA